TAILAAESRSARPIELPQPPAPLQVKTEEEAGQAVAEEEGYRPDWPRPNSDTGGEFPLAIAGREPGQAGGPCEAISPCPQGASRIRHQCHCWVYPGNGWVPGWNGPVR